MMQTTYSRRGLYEAPSPEDFLTSPSQEPGFKPFFWRPGTCCEMTGTSTNIVVESTKESSWSLSGSMYLRDHAPEITGCSPEAIEDWTLYSLWSAQVDELIEGLVGRRIPMEQGTFMDGVSAHLKQLFTNFQASIFSQDLMVLVVTGDVPVTNASSQCQIEVSQVSFRMPETKSNEKTRSNYSLRSYGDLGIMLGRTVRKSDVLIISGSIPVESENESLVEVNSPFMQRYCCIVRLRKREEETSTGEFILGESIEPIPKDPAEWTKGRRFSFDYVLVIPRGKVQVRRQRPCCPDKRGSSMPRSVLDTHFFPITGALQDCVDTLAYYNWDRDPTWPQKFGPYSRYAFQLPRKLRWNTRKLGNKTFGITHHRSSSSYKKVLVATLAVFFSVSCLLYVFSVCL